MAEPKTVKTVHKYNCSLCNFNTSDKKDYNRHLLTRKHITNIKMRGKPDVKYTCEKCKYVTCDKSKYNRHLLSKKHNKIPKPENTNYKYICSLCNYKTVDKNDYTRHLDSANHKNNETINGLTETYHSLK